MGRMALTNYLMQSVVLGCVFYGYGFGLFGRIGPAAAAGIGVAIYLVQVHLSRLYLRRFRFGPFEWVWRSLSYGYRQPMRVAPGSSHGIRVSRGTGIAVQAVMFPSLHALVPWALSLLATRHGWAGEWPSPVNLAGLIPATAGFYFFLLGTREHYLAAPGGWLFERTPHFPTPCYLLTDGAYRYSRNPIYLAELVTWLGWIVFYGSFVVAGIFAAAAVVVGSVIVPREERGLEVRFGDEYRQFRRTTPRWLGKVERKND